MAFSIPPRARIILGVTTVGLFLLAGLSFFPTQPVLAWLLLALACLRFVLLLKQISVSRKRGRRGD